MAAKIFHGAPGSYKSASAFWFEVLPALRLGRVVVTNIEGVLTKESIEMELDEVFPESADIWRLSSQTEDGLFLWRRWFWWMPVKAFIIIDEVQDVFPNDAKVFKPEDLDSKGIESIKNLLPKKFYDHYKVAIKDFKPDLSEGTSDDTGQTILDENGDILYPRLMREANMRHRKYNWDIIYCTPEITEIHKLVRSVCESAFFHKYNESLEFIPYFKRRPRIHEHSPKSSGVPKKNDDPTKWRRVPIEVHKCYRSTSTGKITKLGAVNAFKSPKLIFIISLLFIAVCYSFWWGVFKEDSKTIVERGSGSSEESVSLSSKASFKNTSLDSSVNSNKDDSSVYIPLELPYNSKSIYMTGYQTVYLNSDRRYKEYFFSLRSGKDEILMDSNDMYYFGFTIEYVNDCTINLRDGNSMLVVRCTPTISKPPIIEKQSDYKDPSVSL
jgi:zona occludens toxin